MRRVAFVLAATTLTGCLNLRAATSGEVGCPASEIEIRDEETVFGGKNWTAECNGQVYYCSYQATGEESGQYSCTADASSTDTSGGEVAAQASEKPGAAAETAPPTEAVGFQLAQSAESAEAKCTEAGHTWSVSGEAQMCSGTAVSVGVEAKSRLVFCNDQLCDLTAFVTFQGEDASADTQLNKILNAMRDKYGVPKKVRENGLPSCRAEGVVRCTSSGGSSLSQTWEWTSGEKIYLTFKGKQGQAVLAVRYLTKNATGGVSAF